MASSFKIDLGLSLGLTQQVIELVSRATVVSHPNFISSRGPVTIINYVLWDNDVAIGVTRGMLTPRDMHVWGKEE